MQENQKERYNGRFSCQIPQTMDVEQEQKIRELLSSDFSMYPRDRYKVYIASQKGIDRQIEFLNKQDWSFSHRYDYTSNLVKPRLWEDVFEEAMDELHKVSLYIPGKIVIYAEREPHPNINKSLLYFYEACTLVVGESPGQPDAFVFLPVYGRSDMQDRFSAFIRYIRPGPDWAENAQISQYIQHPALRQCIYNLLIEKSGLDKNQSAAFLEINHGQVNILTATTEDDENFVTEFLEFLTYKNIAETYDEPENKSNYFLNDYLSSLTQYGSHEAVINLLMVLSADFKVNGDSLLLQYLLNVIEKLNIIREEMKPSSVYVDAQFRIFLPEFDGLEIEMRPFLKAVYLFFLKKPEGLDFYDLADCKAEIKGIYYKISDELAEEDVEQYLDDMCDDHTNLFNEICLRIKESLLIKLDNHLACHYYIERGSENKMSIPIAARIDRVLEDD